MHGRCGVGADRAQRRRLDLLRPGAVHGQPAATTITTSVPSGEPARRISSGAASRPASATARWRTPPTPTCSRTRRPSRRWPRGRRSRVPWNPHRTHQQGSEVSLSSRREAGTRHGGDRVSGGSPHSGTAAARLRGESARAPSEDARPATRPRRRRVLETSAGDPDRADADVDSVVHTAALMATWADAGASRGARDRHGECLPGSARSRCAASRASQLGDHIHAHRGNAHRGGLPAGAAARAAR